MKAKTWEVERDGDRVIVAVDDPDGRIVELHLTEPSARALADRLFTVTTVDDVLTDAGEPE